ncbi:hypothetical protein BQ8794_80156 [Mesorhizobium prunaredense]|uniref:Uncharacterized protein n=1 Tax=Mesorhizobium prunaredense TaxID=1631249 RepID=A0A1R3VLP9_9HYPH|nr:hypothetical protein BQ8794_80156 [Mesorhizobium prunaredense]
MLVPADQFKQQGSRPLAAASLIEFEPNLRNAALNILNGASAPGHAAGAPSRNATRFNAPRGSPASGAPAVLIGGFRNSVTLVTPTGHFPVPNYFKPNNER